MVGECPRCGTVDVVLINGCCEPCNNEMMREALEDLRREEYRREEWKRIYGED